MVFSFLQGLKLGSTVNIETMIKVNHTVCQSTKYRILHVTFLARHTGDTNKSDDEAEMKWFSLKDLQDIKPPGLLSPEPVELMPVLDNGKLI